ncbi:hypothetical protein Bpfe_014221, partial [Biomphalaria pfeifferi]
MADSTQKLRDKLPWSLEVIASSNISRSRLLVSRDIGQSPLDCTGHLAEAERRFHKNIW